MSPSPRSPGKEGRLPMERDGLRYAVALFAAATACGLALGPWAAVPWLVLAIFCLYFFRDPERAVPVGPLCVSPADGKVVRVFEESDTRTRVSIFLSIFDVHVNRIPVGGRIRSIRYSRGSFRMAHREVASVDNERNTLVIEQPGGETPVEVSQIAGLIARRIVCRKREGDTVEMGERFGLIKFGSRVDILLGPEWEIAVRRGDRVAGGSSVLARRK